jgi:CheY-like chemotaxis protein
MTQTVLYIEDNKDNIRLIERLLSRRPNVRLLTAGTGRDGVDAATAQRPALILLDNRLPDATGTSVLRELTADQATAGIPVIVITGDSADQTAKDLLASGATEFIAKPFDIQGFLAAVDRYLS